MDLSQDAIVVEENEESGKAVNSGMCLDEYSAAVLDGLSIESQFANEEELRRCVRPDIVRKIVDRYREVCRRSLPELTEGEWWLIVDVLNGS
jgi:hypothetical protein